MNDTIFKSNTSGSFYKKCDSGSFILKKNILRFYEWSDYEHDDIPSDVVETTLLQEQFMECGNEQYRLSNNTIQEHNPDFITNSFGGFSVARNADSEFVRETHTAVRSFNSWVPSSEGQKRFKQTIEDIEARAKREEETVAFANGRAAPDFQNPI